MANRLSLKPWVLEAGLIALLTVIAFLVRFNGIGELPAGIQGDEAEFAIQAQRIASGEWIGAWTGVTLGNPTGYLYWAAAFFKLGEPTIFTLRLSTVVLGTIIIPVTYLLVRLLFTPRIALLTATLATFSVWYLIQSRLGWPLILSILLLLLCMYFLIWGWRTGKIGLFAIGGMFLGLGLYSFKIFLPYFFAVSGLMVLSLLLARSRDSRKLVVMFLTVALVAGSHMLFYYFTNFNIRDNLATQYSVQNSPSVSGLLSRAIEVILYVHNPLSHDGVDATGGSPIFDRISELFFWIGVLLSSMRINRRPYQFVFLAFLVAIVPAVLVPGAESRRLLFGVLVALMFVSIGVDFAIRVVLKGFSDKLVLANWSRLRELAGYTAVSIGVAGFLLFFATTNINSLNKWATDQSTDWSFSYELVEAFRYIEQTDSDAYLYFYSGRWNYDNPVRRFILADTLGETKAKEFGASGGLEIGGHDKVVYLFMRDYYSLSAAVQNRYPGGEYHEKLNDKGEVIFAAYSVVP